MLVRSLPSAKASATATGSRIANAATAGIKNWFKRNQLPLSSSVRENKFSYSSASNMMAVKQDTKKPDAKNAVKAATPAPLAVVLSRLPTRAS